VLTRSRRPSTCAFPCEQYVQRTVWDGDQLRYEIRSSGKAGTETSYMNLEGAVAPGDDPNLFGIVQYAHVHGIDQPVGIVKRYATATGASTSNWGYVTPHANYRGEWSYGTFSNGSYCLTVGQSCPNWPGFYLSMDGWAQGAIPPSYTVWWGSIVRGTADASGLQYLRNRYYDPKTGRFTQLDPIGLAGGMNLYGFAAGDPVNFSDPFGLLPIVPAACAAAPAACAAAGAAIVRGASLVARTPAAQRTFQAASARAHQLGRAGERFVQQVTGLVKNVSERLGSRVPDFVDRAGNVFHEAKNTQQVGLTAQIREMIGNLQEGQRLIIHVREAGTTISRNLDPFIERGLVEIIRDIPK